MLASKIYKLAKSIEAYGRFTIADCSVYLVKGIQSWIKVDFDASRDKLFVTTGGTYVSSVIRGTPDDVDIANLPEKKYVTMVNEKALVNLLEKIIFTDPCLSKGKSKDFVWKMRYGPDVTGVSRAKAKACIDSYKMEKNEWYSTYENTGTEKSQKPSHLIPITYKGTDKKQMFDALLTSFMSVPELVATKHPQFKYGILITSADKIHNDISKHWMESLFKKLNIRFETYSGHNSNVFVGNFSLLVSLDRRGWTVIVDELITGRRL